MGAPHGQHFLANRGAVATILARFAPGAGDRVVEIGPGRGALTRPLLERAGALAAVEIDPDLARPLAAQLRLPLLEWPLARGEGGAPATGPGGEPPRFVLRADALEVDYSGLAALLGARPRGAPAGDRQPPLLGRDRAPAADDPRARPDRGRARDGPEGGRRPDPRPARRQDVRPAQRRAGPVRRARPGALPRPPVLLPAAEGRLHRRQDPVPPPPRRGSARGTSGCSPCSSHRSRSGARSSRGTSRSTWRSESPGPPHSSRRRAPIPTPAPSSSRPNRTSASPSSCAAPERGRNRAPLRRKRVRETGRRADIIRA